VTSGPDAGGVSPAARRAFSAPDAPAPIGPYSPALRAGNLLFLSGQVPLTADGTIAGPDLATQTEQVMRNISALLAAAGAGFEHVARTTVFLVDLYEFAEMNAVYGRFVGKPAPKRSTVQVSRLPRDVRVEIDVIAVMP
jgi:2-iminobutanoate/2-iminopropanoate deaminase